MASNQFDINKTLDLTGKKWDDLNDTAECYSLIYANHMNYLTDVVTSIYEWKNLPVFSGKKWRSTFIEMILMYNGSLAYAETKSGNIFSPCSPINGYNLMGDPVKLVLQPNNAPWLDGFVSTGETVEKFVFIRNTPKAASVFPYVTETAKALTECFMSLQANVQQQKFPMVFTATKENKISVEVAANKWMGFSPFMIVKQKLADMLQQAKPFNLSAPYVADKLMETYQEILMNFYTRLGINTPGQEKKERLIMDEVNANNQVTEISSDIYLRSRKEAAEQINEMFGTDISIEKNNSLYDTLQKKGGDE